MAQSVNAPAVILSSHSVYAQLHKQTQPKNTLNVRCDLSSAKPKEWFKFQSNSFNTLVFTNEVQGKLLNVLEFHQWKDEMCGNVNFFLVRITHYPNNKHDETSSKT
jgi:hypothetical protein